MTTYERIREIFNSCSNNQMRDVFFDEVTVAQPEDAVRPYLTGSDVTCERDERPDGTVIFDIEASGLRQRVTLTPTD